eukprot:782668-Amphidinium_carterae.1
MASAECAVVGFGPCNAFFSACKQRQIEKAPQKRQNADNIMRDQVPVKRRDCKWMVMPVPCNPVFTL